MNLFFSLSFHFKFSFDQKKREKLTNNNFISLDKSVYFNIFNILASENGNLEIVKLLCQNNAELNHQVKDGCTAIMMGILLNLYLNLNYLF
jgi:hypothetical protein